MPGRGQTLDVSRGVLVLRASRAEARVARLAGRLAELRRIWQHGGIVEVLEETEVGVEAFEESGEAGHVGLRLREQDDAWSLEIWGSGLRVMHQGIDGGEAVVDNSPELREELRYPFRYAPARLQSIPPNARLTEG